MTTQTLNPWTLPLRGASLIEASAGTGKTYTLAALYLRLLLGLGGQAAYPRPLSVEDILVVTFTEAATEELRGRIRENIHRLRLACVRGESSTPLYRELLTQIPDREQASRRLLAAERQMDEAAIFTIHGFCQRMLNHNAVESGLPFQQTLLEDESDLRRQACADFWRRHCYPLSGDIARVVSAYWDGPGKLLTELLPYLQGEAPALVNPPEKNETLEARHAGIVGRIDALKREWLRYADQLLPLVSGSGVDKRVYSGKNLPAWFEKVSSWAGASTRDYQVPAELERFRQSALNAKTVKGAAPTHPLFGLIDHFFSQPRTLRDLVFVRALEELRQTLEEEKRLRGEMGFDDLLSRFDRALRGPGGDALAKSVRDRFPVALIDEFQDTDPLQYRIFRTLYQGRDECGLILIGDPKQAIYAFRGADIFTYMRARSEVAAHYTLDTNWRSSASMVNAVNRLFQSVLAPFIFEQIPFSPVLAASSGQNMALRIDGDDLPALQFWLPDGDGLSVGDYQQLMAGHCAATIRDWLSASRDGRAILVNGEDRRPVAASDMTVLVRNRMEASLIRDALGRLSIPAVYLSNRDSVFATPEARELLWLMQAILMPGQDSALRCALATSLMGLDARDIDDLNENGAAWDDVVDEFAGYRQVWRRQGVLPMLRQVMAHRRMAENLLVSVDGERRLTDVLHLAELVQEASVQLDNAHALVRWLALQIETPDVQADNQQLRLESDRHLVRIVTVHKSKGLEYPLVFLPFIADFRAQKRPFFHDRDNYRGWLDLASSDESLRLAEEERLAEDLRLLYVAVTRSIYYCGVGIAPLFRHGRKKNGDSDVHRGALGYLVQQGLPGDAGALRSALSVLTGDGIALTSAGQCDGRPWRPAAPQPVTLAARTYRRAAPDIWRVASYTSLQRHGGGSPLLDPQPGLDSDAVGESQPAAAAALTPHTFPRGAAAGTFLHGLFETLDFTAVPDTVWLAEQATQHGFDPQWLPVLEQWLSRILHAPLDKGGIMLSQLSPGDCQAELQFYLPIDRRVSAAELDKVCKRHDMLSAQCPPLDFADVKGMLKGFIDLVFRWQDRYYLLDYKSNWLGESADDYTADAMLRAMAAHRYDLQYQLYTLAVHRYLRHRLPGYDYRRHFGGVFYVFLRGVAPDRPGDGVVFRRPAPEFVAALDRLFGKENMATAQDGAH
ncbi:exodeoxyribonuclease V subunit beta [Martelella alba]|uniref:exodeoxyribonuclease V subunit beta n=1 Tax=Martelella alba TaxID=2590451 RepID=UPI001E60E537|nr:exodeoxyribonuclease V subunit beta [Martelella alba]